MDIQKKGVLALLQSGLTGKAQPLPEGFDPQEGAAVARRHQVVGLYYEGAVKCGVDKKLPWMQELFGIYYKNLLRSEQQLRSLQKLFAAFEERGIRYLPLKGVVLKPLYPRPELRPMGDADILISMDQYELIRPLMLELGYAEGDQSGHEIHWESPAIHIELHKQLVPEDTTRLPELMGNGWDRALPERGSRYTYTPEDHYLFLFAHYTKHYIRGIGIRQLLDLVVWEQAYPQMDMEQVAQRLDAIDLLDFYRNTRKMLSCWFEGGVETDRTLFQTDYVFSCGSWGTAEGAQRSKAVWAAKRLGTGRKARGALLRAAIFPSLSVMRSRYGVLKKAPWLLPVMYVVRMLDALLFRRSRIRTRAKSVEFAGDENLRQIERNLAFVGLDMERF